MKKIYFYGCGKKGEILSALYKNIIKVEGFISDFPEDRQKVVNGLKVYSLDEVLKKDDFIIVVTTNSHNHSGHDKILAHLKEIGLTPEEDFFSYKDLYRICGIFQTHLDLHVTTKCTLRCKHCIFFVPYVKPIDRDINIIKNDLRYYFKFVDHVYSVGIVGGETFLYSELGELLEFIGENYRDKINTVTLVTNGTIIPSSLILKLLSKYNVRVSISDYSKIDLAQKQREKLINALESENVSYVIRCMEHLWIDGFGDPKIQKHDSEKVLQKLFHNCSMLCRTLWNKKLYFCASDFEAKLEGYVPDLPDDYIDLSEEGKDEIIKQKLVNLENGITPRGYVELCKNCYGFTGDSKRFIAAAEQV